MAPSKDKQDKTLKQFRQELERRDLIHEGDTIGTDDATLLRFLRARQFDLNAAITMWSNCQKWRKTVEGVGIDELYRRLDPYDYPERSAVFDCWPLWFHKTDKKGRPLNIHHFGGINMPELYKYVTPQKFWQTIVVNAESLTREVLPASSRAAGHHIDGTFVIVDLKGFGISQFWQMKNLARDSFQISQDYFPETMAHLAIINAPSSFTTIWSFIKPWLAKETLAKIEILGSDYKDVLLQQIPEENLPTGLGGTCTCDGLGGCKLSNAGPWMANRKERRERWLRGERTRIGLGMEGEDEDDRMWEEEQRPEQDQEAELEIIEGQVLVLVQERVEEPLDELKQEEQAPNEYVSMPFSLPEVEARSEQGEQVPREHAPTSPSVQGVQAALPQQQSENTWTQSQPALPQAASASERVEVESSARQEQHHAASQQSTSVSSKTSPAAAYSQETEVVNTHDGVEKVVETPESSPYSTLGPGTPETDDSRSFRSASSSFGSEVASGSGKSAGVASTGKSLAKKLRLSIPKTLLGKKKSRSLSRDENKAEKNSEPPRSLSKGQARAVADVSESSEAREAEMGDFGER